MGSIAPWCPLCPIDHIIATKALTARGVYGFFPANAVGDDVELYCDEGRACLQDCFHFLRQQADREGKEPCRSLADFIAPKQTDLKDSIGAFAVTSGLGLHDLTNRYKAEHDDYSAILAEAIADRLAEAFAEALHKQVRDEWGYGCAEGLTNEQMIKEEYRGIRPAPGYPACPDHTEKATLFRLLDATKACDVTLSESFAMSPPSSVSGFYFSHPESRYFAVGKIGRDQIESLAERKGESVADIERWLRPNLSY